MRLTLSDIQKLAASGKIRGYSENGPIVSKSKAPKKSKYGNRKMIVDNITFDSEKEGRRYQDLKLLLQAGEITDLKLQVKFDLGVCKYIADFTYMANGVFCVEDVKSEATRKVRLYRVKKKLMKERHDITIIET